MLNLLRRVNIEAAPDKPDEDDLDTAYMQIFGDLMDKLNTEYIRLLRECLADEFRVIDARQNAGADGTDRPSMAFHQFRKRIFDIGEKIDKSKVFRNIFKSMESVFVRIDDKLKKGIFYQFKKEKQPIPQLAMRAPSQALKAAINLNTDLITTITKKQSELLANTVQKAVRGGADFKAIVSQVMEQADKGKSYAQFVARDQCAKAYAGISEERQKTAGFPNFEWVCVNIPPTPAKNKGEVRPDHWHLNHKIFSWKDLPIIDGERVKPGEPVNCRCKAKATFRPVTGAR